MRNCPKSNVYTSAILALRHFRTKMFYSLDIKYFHMIILLPLLVFLSSKKSNKQLPVIRIVRAPTFLPPVQPPS